MSAPPVPVVKRKFSIRDTTGSVKAAWEGGKFPAAVESTLKKFAEVVTREQTHAQTTLEHVRYELCVDGQVVLTLEAHRGAVPIPTLVSASAQGPGQAPEKSSDTAAPGGPAHQGDARSGPQPRSGPVPGLVRRSADGRGAGTVPGPGRQVHQKSASPRHEARQQTPTPYHRVSRQP